MNALAKSSMWLLTATAIAVFLYVWVGEEGFDPVRSRSQPQEEICERDGDRLAQLQAKPSLDKAVRFAGELQCLQLWPQLETILDSLSRTARSTTVSSPDGPASDTIPASEAAPTTASPAMAATSAALDDACKHDADRLAELQAKPSRDEALRFEHELKCSGLQPQVLALLDSLSQLSQSAGTPTPDGAPPHATSGREAAPPAPEPETKSAAWALSPSEAPSNAITAGETTPPASEPPTREAKSAAGALSPNGFPPDTASAGAAPPGTSEPPVLEATSGTGELSSSEAPLNTAAAGAADTNSTSEATPPHSGTPAREATSTAANDACKQDEERLARLRTNPSSEEATGFYQELRCETLRPELLALTGELGKPPPTQTGSVSNEARGARNAVNDAQPPSQAIADAERRIAALESDKEALAAEVSKLQRNQVPPSAEQPPQPAPPAERSEPQSASQATEDAARRIAALESEKEALAAEVSKLQHDHEASSPEQATPTPSPQPASPAERSEAEAASQAAADAGRRIAELESEKLVLTAEVSKLQRDREASSIPPPPPAAHAERFDAEPAAALASLPEGMQARVLIRYLKSNADARAQAEKLASALVAQGVEMADVRESRSAIRTELSFSYAPDETIARQVGRVVGVAPVRRLQSKDGLMVRPGTVELNLSGDSHLAAIKTNSTRESNHE